jgi:hypothetical protein
MKRLALLVLALGLSAPVPATTGFCEGFEDGYKAGWCYQESYCLEPLSPLCPLPKLGEDGYQDGYNRGFVTGIQARSARG